MYKRIFKCDLSCNSKSCLDRRENLYGEKLYCKKEQDKSKASCNECHKGNIYKAILQEKVKEPINTQHSTAQGQTTFILGCQGYSKNIEGNGWRRRN